MIFQIWKWYPYFIVINVNLEKWIWVYFNARKQRAKSCTVENLIFNFRNSILTSSYLVFLVNSWFFYLSLPKREWLTFSKPCDLMLVFNAVIDIEKFIIIACQEQNLILTWTICACWINIITLFKLVNMAFEHCSIFWIEISKIFRQLFYFDQCF